MKDERIIEEISYLDGFKSYQTEDGLMFYRTHKTRSWGMNYCEDYLKSHSAIQNVLEKQEEEQLERYLRFLDVMIHSTPSYSDSRWSNKEIVTILLASPRQKCEALLKAFGKWSNNTSDITQGEQKVGGNSQ